MTAPSSRNAFVALCELASSERWCWDIMCTTCGHQNFRHGFIALARGDHPDAPTWKIRDHGRPGMLPASLGRVPGPGAFTLAVQQRLSAILAAASLAEVRRVARYPDWLGYLGLGLLHTQGAESDGAGLTRAWAPQLATLLGDRASRHPWLATLRPTGDRLLGWGDLGRIEYDLAPIDDEFTPGR